MVMAVQHFENVYTDTLISTIVDPQTRRLYDRVSIQTL